MEYLESLETIIITAAGGILSTCLAVIAFFLRTYVARLEKLEESIQKHTVDDAIALTRLEVKSNTVERNTDMLLAAVTKGLYEDRDTK